MASGDNDPAWLKHDQTKAPLLPPPEEKAPDVDDDEEVGRASSAGGGKKHRRSVGAGSSRKKRQQRRITKPFFAVLATLTALSALAAMATNLYVLVADGQEEKETDDGVDRVILRGFGVVLGLFVILRELGFKWWRKLCPLLDYLFARGAFIALVGFLTLSDFSNWTEPQNVVGLIMLCCAGCYLSAGLLCIRRTHTLE